MRELNMVRFLLNIIVFVSGAVLMGLEIVGSRVLAPYFGSSIFVWGSLISVVMAALSIGYYWGGWLSAREPSYGRLLTLLLIPLMGVTNIIHSMGITLVCLSLLVVPLLRLRSVAVGRAVTALSIIGSIAIPWPSIVWARLKTLLEKDTFYHRIRVEEDDEAR